LHSDFGISEDVPIKKQRRPEKNNPLTLYHGYFKGSTQQQNINTWMNSDNLKTRFLSLFRIASLFPLTYQ